MAVPDETPPSASTDVEFLSETGERRTYTVLALDEQSWAGVNELAWRTLLQRARTGRYSGGFPHFVDGEELPS